MATAVISKRGHIIIPARVRAELGVAAATRVEFVKTDAGWFLHPANLSVTALKGILGKPPNPVAVGDLNRIIRCRGSQ